MKGEVVTVFLRYRDKVLVLKRSMDVGTYRGHWAGVSGYIEEAETPLEAAGREVREETGVSKVSLVREGRPLSINDQDRKWVVHPFLFDVTTDKLTLDWEHDDCRWIEPDEVKGLNTVPWLYEALKEVLR
jgi:8-oxo-dGTP pyrophosphatase MutT (NUDIX family)